MPYSRLVRIYRDHIQIHHGCLLSCTISVLSIPMISSVTRCRRSHMNMLLGEGKLGICNAPGGYCVPFSATAGAHVLVFHGTRLNALFVRSLMRLAVRREILRATCLKSTRNVQWVHCRGQPAESVSDTYGAVWIKSCTQILGRAHIVHLDTLFGMSFLNISSCFA
jgi:hypothetical protein